MTTLSATCSCSQPIVGAFFSLKKKNVYDDFRGCAVTLEEVPYYRRLFNSFPDRFLLEGWEEACEIRHGMPEKWLYVPESHTVWVATQFLDSICQKGEEIWSYGAGFLGKDRRIVVRECNNGHVAINSEQESAWLSSEPPPYLVKAVEHSQRSPKKLPAEPTPRAPKAITASGSGGGSSGTAVTKMTPEERAEYKARLLAKPVLTDRDRRHLARIEKLGG